LVHGLMGKLAEQSLVFDSLHYLAEEGGAEDGEQEAQWVGHGQEHGPVLLDAPRPQVERHARHHKTLHARIVVDVSCLSA